MSDLARLAEARRASMRASGPPWADLTDEQRAWWMKLLLLDVEDTALAWWAVQGPYRALAANQEQFLNGFGDYVLSRWDQPADVQAHGTQYYVELVAGLLNWRVATLGYARPVSMADHLVNPEPA